MLGEKTVLDHVIDNAIECCTYLNNFKEKNGFVASAALCIPYNDPIKERYQNKINIIVEGPEDDVLERYKILVSKMDPDYLVRVTGDCCLLPGYVITKHINVAVKNTYDYVSNVDERIRTTLDGFDVEVISRRLFDYTAECAKIQHDREHVTTWMRRCTPTWARVGHVVGYLDFADVKLSVDTPEDLERVRKHYDKIQLAIKVAEDLHGKRNVHRL